MSEDHNDEKKGKVAVKGDSDANPEHLIPSKLVGTAKPGTPSDVLSLVAAELASLASLHQQIDEQTAKIEAIKTLLGGKKLTAPTEGGSKVTSKKEENEVSFSAFSALSASVAAQLERIKMLEDRIQAIEARDQGTNKEENWI